MKNKIKAAVAGFVLLTGCTHTHLVCPRDSIQTAIIGGSNLAQTVTALAPVAVALAPLFLDKAPDKTTTPAHKELTPDAQPTPAPVIGQLDNYSLDIFGTTYVSCGNQQPPVGK